MTNDKIVEAINQLRREKNATILAHTYQAPEIQDLADFTGDSLQLSVQARETDSQLIVFCGVRFMAETAAMLNPKSRVLLPAEDAGCPMADMITADQLRELKARHPGAAVVCYVNSSAAVKAESDICCTSSNAVRVLQSLPADQPVIFVPDVNLGSWAAKQAKREVILWSGFCPVHQWGFERRKLEKMLKEHPGFTFLAHPECDEDILELADRVMSTSGMVRFVQDHDQVIIATDHGLVQYLRHIHPDKQIVEINPRARCKNMQKTTLHHVLEALQHEQHLVTVPPEIAVKAVQCLDRMLALPR